MEIMKKIDTFFRRGPETKVLRWRLLYGHFVYSLCWILLSFRPTCVIWLHVNLLVNFCPVKLCICRTS